MRGYKRGYDGFKEIDLGIKLLEFFLFLLIVNIRI